MKNELYTLFYSPIAWLVLIIFAFQAGMAFSDAYLDQLRQQALDYSLYGVTRSLLFGWDGVISSMQRQLYLYIPLLTMGLMSQEYNRGSIKLLYSSPITNKQIIFGKYLAIIVYILVLIAFLFIYILFSLFTIKNMSTRNFPTSFRLCSYRTFHVHLNFLSSCGCSRDSCIIVCIKLYQ